MKGYWNQLRPLEKRMLVAIGAAVFIVLNAWFVVPHFSDWGKMQRKMEGARKTLALFEGEIANEKRLQNEVRRLEDDGTAVPQEEQATHFASTIQSQVVQTGVGLKQTGKIQSATNQNFFELSQIISVESKEQQLVDFLYKLGEGNSLIRVRNLTLHPDAPRQLLAANITLVGSYQRKMPARGSASSSAPPRTPAAKSAAPTAAPSQTTQPKSTPPVTSPTKQPAPAPGLGGTNALTRKLLNRPALTNKPGNTKKD